MPLHEWTEKPGWEGVHHLWIAELLRWIKPRLPAGYRAHIGSVPTIAVGAPPEKPDVIVCQWPQEQVPAEPDKEIAVTTIDPSTGVYIERQGRLTAAVELISPRNKDRPSSRAAYLARYVGYLLEGVNLLLVDVHRRPAAHSFADEIAHELQMTQPPLPAPFAVGYRVGEPAATGGRLLAVWRRPLTAGAALPVLPLPLTVDTQITVDLEQTYQRAPADAYLSKESMMTWPPELIAAFAQALQIEPENGTPKDQLIVAMLDAATRRIVWRADGDPARVVDAMRRPYTPLGSVVGDGIDGRVKKLTLKGHRWGPAVDAFYAYVEANAAALFDALRDEGEPYDDSLS